MFTPRTGDDAGNGRRDNYGAEIRNGGASNFANAPLDVAFPTGEHQFAVTRSGTGANGVLSLYLDGTLNSQNPAANQDPTAIVFENDWLGRSNWSGDPFYVGSINEFRVYDNALPLSAIAFNAAQGPNGAVAVPEPASASLLGLGALALLRRRRRA